MTRRKLSKFLSGRGLGVLAIMLAAVCALPHLAVLVTAFSAGTEVLQHLAETVLPHYIGSTLALVALVCTLAFLVGTGTAWLVTMTEFPGRRWLEVLLVIPLAFPAYVVAFGYTHVLDHPGIVQSTLRDLTGWGPRDYWFPEVRSLGGAAVMLALVLYPYVYLLARAAFLSQSATTFHAARALGRTPWQAFLTVSLPMARPAIAAGVLLAGMETIADFGTVSFFAVQTFATGIYQSWFNFADRVAAAQLALGLLAFALCLATLERMNRGSARYHAGRRQEAMVRMQLTGARARWATAACALPVLLGAVIPTIALGLMALGSEQDLLSRRYIGFIQNSLILASVAAGVTVLAAMIIGTFHRTTPGKASNTAFYLARIGYAVPGGVIAVGLLFPLA
ncbi:MAG: iron ABC transporter permease, partial [Pseudomonadota bacterium]